MILSAAAATSVGLQRKANEDCCAVVAELGLYVVADGMGGHAAGQLASDLACKAVVAAIRGDSGGRVSERLLWAVECANREILATARRHPEHAGMGTTVVALLVDGERAALAHVGDSRAYRVRGGRIRQLTDDHSVVGELVRRREISPDAAREHPHRHVLTRALGVRPQAEPDLAELNLSPQDVFVLCTDGLTTHVSADEIAKAVGGETEPREACERLVSLADARGGEDNTTVVLVRCEGS